MKATTRTLCIVLTLLMLVSVFSACGKQGGEETKPDAELSSVATSAPTGTKATEPAKTTEATKPSATKATEPSKATEATKPGATTATTAPAEETKPAGGIDWSGSSEPGYTQETKPATEPTTKPTEAPKPTTPPATTAPTTPKPTEAPKPTTPPATEAPKPTETTPPATTAPTAPPATEAPKPTETTPPATEPQPTTPPATEPPATEPPANVNSVCGLEGCTITRSHTHWNDNIALPTINHSHTCTQENRFECTDPECTYIDKAAQEAYWAEEEKAQQDAKCPDCGLYKRSDAHPDGCMKYVGDANCIICGQPVKALECHHH